MNGSCGCPVGRWQPVWWRRLQSLPQPLRCSTAPRPYSWTPANLLQSRKPPETSIGPGRQP